MQYKNKFAITALTAAMAIISLLTLSVSADAAEDDMRPHSWYVMRTRDHSQPPLEANMSFIEDYDGYYVDKARANEKVVYLTFDAGYENGNVARILDTMKEKNVQGAFFILDNMIERFPDLVLRMRDEGHLVCNHTCKHRDMSAVGDKGEFERELSALNEKYRALTGDNMAMYYRPPEGRFCLRNLKHASELGYKTVFWSFAYADWDNDKQPSPEKATATILDNVHNGAVLLLHPTSKTNADILGNVIDALKKEGYRFGTLHELTNKCRTE